MNKTDTNAHKISDVTFDDTLSHINDVAKHDCVCHAYCHKGSATFVFNGRRYTMAAGDCLIVRFCNLVSDVREDSGFHVDVVYVTPQFILLAMPQSNYGTRGGIALFHNPIMHLNGVQQQVCALNFDYIRRRLSIRDHKFHRDALLNAVQAMIIDFFDFHATLFDNEQTLSPQYSALMNRFLAILERGDYRRHRDIGYYVMPTFSA